MRILYAGAVNIGVEGASKLHFLHLVRALQSKGHELVVAAGGYPGCERVDGLEIHYAPHFMVRGALPLNHLAIFLLAARLAITARFDVLYHRGVPLLNRWARIFGIPSIVEVNGIIVDELRSFGRGELPVRLSRCLEQHIVSDACRVVCVTEGIREQLVSRYGMRRDQGIVIPNAADTELFRPLPKLECQRRVGLKPGDYNVGFVGAFQPWVDLKCLLAATKSLRDQNVPMHLTLVGDGPEYEKVKRCIEQYGLTETIRLVGRVPHEMVPQWIGAFDVCVAPFTRARNELIGLSPLKLFEYMACARPVVATALSGIVEPVERSRSGLLYRTEDKADLAHQLLSLYRNPDLWEAMGTRGREYAVKHHSWDSVAERVEGIMLDVSASSLSRDGVSSC